MIFHLIIDFQSHAPEGLSTNYTNYHELFFKLIIRFQLAPFLQFV